MVPAPALSARKVKLCPRLPPVDNVITPVKHVENISTDSPTMPFRLPSLRLSDQYNAHTAKHNPIGTPVSDESSEHILRSIGTPMGEGLNVFNTPDHNRYHPQAPSVKRERFVRD